MVKFGQSVHLKQVNKEECDRMQREYHAFLQEVTVKECDRMQREYNAFLQEVAVEEQHYVQGNPV